MNNSLSQIGFLFWFNVKNVRAEEVGEDSSFVRGLICFRLLRFVRVIGKGIKNTLARGGWLFVYTPVG